MSAYACGVESRTHGYAGIMGCALPETAGLNEGLQKNDVFPEPESLSAASVSVIE